jgi:ADP-ribose pyrophosphatase YjhB (NUDIX family)
MTFVRSEGRLFRVRAAGIAVHDGHVLLARPAEPSGWSNSALVGGGVGLSESSDATVVREFREELGVDVRVGRLLWCVENHFRHDDDAWHEIGFYWEVDLPPDFPRTGGGEFLDHVVSEDRYVRTRWTWHPIDRLHEVDLRPTFLVDALRDPPRATRFLVHRDAGS